MVVADKAEVELEMTIDKKSFGDGVNFARDTGKKLSQELRSEYQLNFANAQIKLAEFRKQLQDAKKSKDADLIIKAQIDFDQQRSATTQARRELENYTNT